VHPVTLRQWAVDGKIPFVWVGRERRLCCIDVENMKRGGPAAGRLRRGVLDVRVSGLIGQGALLEAREAEVRATAAGEDVVVVRDRGSGLRENRPGLNRVLRLVAEAA
jgi:predicted site-specific integrase-resolvase